MRRQGDSTGSVNTVQRLITRVNFVVRVRHDDQDVLIVTLVLEKMSRTFAWNDTTSEVQVPLLYVSKVGRRVTIPTLR